MVPQTVVAPSYCNDMATTTYGGDSAEGIGAEVWRPITDCIVQGNGAVELSAVEGMVDRQSEGPTQAFPMVGYAHTVGAIPTDDHDLDRLEIEMKEKIEIAKGGSMDNAIRRTDAPEEGGFQDHRVEKDVAGDLVRYEEGHGREEEDDSVKVRYSSITRCFVITPWLLYSVFLMCSGGCENSSSFGPRIEWISHVCPCHGIGCIR